MSVIHLNQIKAAITKIFTDGYDDNGLDVVHYDARERRLYLIQSKWMHSGTGEPEKRRREEVRRRHQRSFPGPLLFLCWCLRPADRRHSSFQRISCLS